MMRLAWDAIITEAAAIVESYETGVTLRQLFYRLVSRELIPNKQSAYSRLSSLTARARREGWFPDLIDNTRIIRRPASWDSVEELMEQAKKQYRRDRSENQTHSIYVAVEKNALATLIASWYAHYGIPVLAFGGYPSQTFVNDILDDIDSQGRPAVLIYGGDFDATGVDILRDFLKRTNGVWDEELRIALNEDQIAQYKLPPLPGKSWDPRAASFTAAYGKLIQVELDALPPDVLKKIYDDAVAQYWDEDEYKEIRKEEEKERKTILLPQDVQEIIAELRYIRDNNEPMEWDSEEPGDVIANDLGKLLARYEDVF
jgi:hypothetical protein